LALQRNNPDEIILNEVNGMETKHKMKVHTLPPMMKRNQKGGLLIFGHF
jgi:hypothetical protein